MLGKVLKNMISGVMASRFSENESRQQYDCPVCKKTSEYYATLDSRKSCEGELVGNHSTTETVDYHWCSHCGFCFAPAMHAWSLDTFRSRIYNDDYVQVDPDYLEKRPNANFTMLENSFGHSRGSIAHLDFGGGNGLLGRLLAASGWRSVSYDPLIDVDRDIGSLGRYDLITAFEVFEHVPDVDALMAALSKLIEENGLIVFSTLLSDGIIPQDRALKWWYAAPRNGHISLFSSDSLRLVLRNHGFALRSLSSGLHAAYVRWPDWANK